MSSLDKCFFFESIDIDSLDYSYILDDDNIMLAPDNAVEDIPEDFPMPCNCIKCARGTVCPCRVKEIPCCNFCKYKSDVCKNPLTVD